MPGILREKLGEALIKEIGRDGKSTGREKPLGVYRLETSGIVEKPKGKKGSCRENSKASVKEPREGFKLLGGVRGKEMTSMVESPDRKAKLKKSKKV